MTQPNSQDAGEELLRRLDANASGDFRINSVRVSADAAAEIRRQGKIIDMMQAKYPVTLSEILSLVAAAAPGEGK